MISSHRIVRIASPPAGYRRSGAPRIRRQMMPRPGAIDDEIVGILDRVFITVAGDRQRYNLIPRLEGALHRVILATIQSVR